MTKIFIVVLLSTLSTFIVEGNDNPNVVDVATSQQSQTSATTRATTTVVCTKPTVSNGRVDCIKCTGLECSVHTVCTFYCENGYKLQTQQNSATCQNNGQWNRQPRCEAIECTKPSNPSSGSVRCSTNCGATCPYFSKCTYTCDTGYQLEGEAIVRCGASGWGSKPTCQIVTCARPTPTPNLQINCPNCQDTQAQCSYNDNCNFKCSEGYKLEGQSKSTCQADGSWSSSPPHCIAIECPQPSTPRSGSVTCSINCGATCPYFSKCTYTCNTGYQLEGKATIRCGASGWSAQPMCQTVTCARPTPSFKLRINCPNCRATQTQCTYDDSCNFECNKGYKLEGQIQSTCQGNGLWSHPSPRCIVVCTKPTVLNGRVNCMECTGQECSVNAVCHYFCDAGYKLQTQQSTSTCNKNGQWNLQSGCEAIKCTKPSNPISGSVTCSNCGGTCSYDAACTYTCNTGYQLSGLATIRCGASGWGSKPTCQILRCPTISLSYGRVQDCRCKRYQCVHGSTCRFSCQSSHMLVGASSSTCSSGRWTEPIPTCNPKWTQIDTINECTFRRSNFKETYNDARANCLLKGWSLAKISENLLHITASMETKFYIGLKQNNTVDWKWEDNSPLGTSLQGTGNCGAVRRQHYERILCTRKRYFICETTRKNVCSGACKNGGTCTKLGCSFTCSCGVQYMGLLCESRKIEITTKSKINSAQGSRASIEIVVKDSLNKGFTCKIMKQNNEVIFSQQSYTHTTESLQQSVNYTITCKSILNTMVYDTKFVEINVEVYPSVEVSHNRIEIFLHQSFPLCHLFCIGSGNPVPAVTWLKYGQKVLSTVYIYPHIDQASRNGTFKKVCLDFTNVRYSEEGNYTCSVKSKLASVPVNKHVYVTVKGSPEEKPSNYQVSQIGNSVTFNCTFQSNPLPSIEWKFSSGKELPKTSQFKLSTFEDKPNLSVTKVLTVYGVSCAETAQFAYKCYASNKYSNGTLESNTFSVDLKNLPYGSYSSCSDAVRYCENRNMALIVVNSRTDFPSDLNNHIWISGQSKVFNSGGTSQCFRIWNKKISKYSGYAYPLCERRNFVTQPNITYTKNKCDSSQLEIRWNLIPGAESLQHKLTYNGITRTMDRGATKYMITGLQANIDYKISVAPLFKGCQNARSLEKLTIHTTDVSLKPVQFVKLQLLPEALTCSVTWSSSNNSSRFQNYELSYEMKPRGLATDLVTQSAIVPKLDLQYRIENVLPNTEYSVKIGVMPLNACVGKVAPAYSSSFTGRCVTASTGPSVVNISSNQPIPDKRGMRINLEPTNERNGYLSCYFLVVRQVANETVNVTTDISKLKQSGESVQAGEFFIAVAKPRFLESIQVTLGDGSFSCCDVNIINETSQNCAVASNSSRQKRSAGSPVRADNRPLAIGSTYQYYILISSPRVPSSLEVPGSPKPPYYVASSLSQPFVARQEANPSPSTNVGLLVGLVVVALVILVLLVLGFILRKRNRRRASGKRPSHRGASAPQTNQLPLQAVRQHNTHEDSFESDPSEVNPVAEKIAEFSISTESLLGVYVRKRANEDRIFTDEFKKTLVDLVSKAKVKTSVGKFAQQHGKNRFKNILPSDDARVVLKQISGIAMSDYINASYIDGYQVASKFIAAQGPKYQTSGDFWRMIVENRCSVIVMLTQLEEHRKSKCYKYWPDVGAEEQHGNVTVKNTKEASCGDFLCRTFTVSSPAISVLLEVKQFQFLAWPDHGVPNVTSGVVRLHRAVVAAYSTSNTGPVVVHCSAGVGRTGTFIAFDILTEQLKCSNHVNVFEIVYNMRLKRTDMVQTVDQYVFVHKLIAEVIACGDTEVDAPNFISYMQSLFKVDRRDHVTGMQKQYDNLNTVPPATTAQLSASKPHNRNLNNDPSVLPYDHNIAFVGMTPHDQEIPYLNGSSVPAYADGFFYMAVQNPPQQNVNNFWRCVIDNQIRCIVMLDDENSCFQYWSSKEGNPLPSIKLETVSTAEFPGYKERDITIARDGSSERHQVKQISLKWNELSLPPPVSCLLEIIPKMTEFQKDAVDVREKKFIAMVHCSDGSKKCGTLISVAILLERLKNENKVDVFRTVKDLRDCREGMVGELGLYRFCYQAVSDFIQSFDLYGNFK